MAAERSRANQFGADPEYGVVLYIAGRCEGDIFEVNEVSEVSFDEPLDDSMFSYSASPEEQVRPAEPIVERMSLSAAVARMPFTVLVPQWLTPMPTTVIARSCTNVREQTHRDLTSV